MAAPAPAARTPPWGCSAVPQSPPRDVGPGNVGSGPSAKGRQSWDIGAQWPGGMGSGTVAREQQLRSVGRRGARPGPWAAEGLQGGTAGSRPGAGTSFCETPAARGRTIVTQAPQAVAASSFLSHYTLADPLHCSEHPLEPARSSRQHPDTGGDLQVTLEWAGAQPSPAAPCPSSPQHRSTLLCTLTGPFPREDLALFPAPAFN